MNDQNDSQKIWKQAFLCRYSHASSFPKLESLAEDYCWYGSYGISYTLHALKTGVGPKSLFEEFSSGFSQVEITHDLLSEGGLMASHFTISAVHTDYYFGLPPTGKKVTFFGCAIARIDASGKIIEERELWDEISLLRQLDVLVDSDDNLLATTDPDTKIPQSVFTPLPLVATENLIFEEDNDQLDQRPEAVSRNINNWIKFLNIKYQSRDFDSLEQVMSPQYRWHGPAGMAWDMSDKDTREKILKGFVEQTDRIKDYQFTYRLFGEGNKVVYNIVTEYTHTAPLINIPASHRTVRHCNISICHFDNDGRITEEWEAIDILAFYKQVGVIPDSPNIPSILSFILSAQEGP